MSTDYNALAKAHWDAQPHPLAPSLTIGEFPIAVKLATKAKFGGHATPEQAALFWKEFQGMEMSPAQFEHALVRLAPLSFTYHGRPPTMNEIRALGDAKPADVRKHYADLPDKDHPHVAAGEMVKALQTARPHFEEHLGRQPTKTEAAYLVHSGEPAVSFAQRLREPTADGSIDSGAQAGRNDPGAGGSRPPGGQPVDQ